MEEKEEAVQQIKFDDFDKCVMVVGQILECRKHPDADRLLIFQIDIGSEKRQIVSSIAEFYQPEELVGKKVVVLSNLKTAKFRGMESQGMLLTGEWGDNQLRILEPGDIPVGTRIS
jgi:methionyl-tRNA synthetase